MKLSFKFWQTSSSKGKRIITIIILFTFSLIATIAGILTPLSNEDAQSLNQELEQVRESVTVQYIFFNNFLICLAMFIPFFGPILGFYAFYNTGVYVAASSITLGAHPIIGFLSLLILPVFWLEFLAYSIALAESVWLVMKAIQGKLRSELPKTGILIAMCAVILITAAIVEMILISAFTPS